MVVATHYQQDRKGASGNEEVEEIPSVQIPLSCTLRDDVHVRGTEQWVGLVEGRVEVLFPYSTTLDMA